MSRTDRTRAGRAAVLDALLESGDHRGAAQVARALQADPAAGAAERGSAAAALARLRPDRGVVALGALCVVVAVAVALGTILRG